MESLNIRSSQHKLPNICTFLRRVHSKISLSPPTAQQKKLIGSNLGTEYSKRVSLWSFVTISWSYGLLLKFTLQRWCKKRKLKLRIWCGSKVKIPQLSGRSKHKSFLKESTLNIGPRKLPQVKFLKNTWLHNQKLQNRESWISEPIFRRIRFIDISHKNY